MFIDYFERALSEVSIQGCCGLAENRHGGYFPDSRM